MSSPPPPAMRAARRRQRVAIPLQRLLGRDRRRPALAQGVAGAVLCVLAVAALWAITVPVYWPVDEVSHVAYARSLAQGRIPTIDTPIGAEGAPGLEARLDFERAAGHRQRMDIWTSNHPPLYYALAGVPMAAGEVVGAPGLGFLAARAVSVLAAAVGVAATAWLARVLAPGRPRVAVAAAAFAALTPSLGHFGGLVFNDSLSFALCTLLLLAAAVVLRDGADRRRVAVVGLIGAAAALTRVSALPLVALAAGACALSAWRASGRGRSGTARWRAGLAAGGVAAAIPTLGAGWFYVRNVLLYGDATGSAALLDKFGRDPNRPLGELLLSAELYLGQWDRLLGDLATGVWVQGWRVPVIRALGGLVLLGLVLAGWRWARSWVGSAGAPSRSAAVAGDLGRRSPAWVLALAFPAGLLLATARFHAEGGSPHGRYLLSALAVVALVAAWGLDHLARRAWPVLLGLGGLLVLHLGAWLAFLRRGAEVWTLEGRLYPLLRIGEGWTTPAAVVLLTALAVGALLVARALVALPPAVSEPG